LPDVRACVGGCSAVCPCPCVCVCVGTKKQKRRRRRRPSRLSKRLFPGHTPRDAATKSTLSAFTLAPFPSPLLSTEAHPPSNKPRAGLSSPVQAASCRNLRRKFGSAKTLKLPGTDLARACLVS
jgi:hypothetical protein